MMQRASERQDLERDSLEVSLIVVPMGVHHAADRAGVEDEIRLP